LEEERIRSQQTANNNDTLLQSSLPLIQQQQQQQLLFQEELQLVLQSLSSYHTNNLDEEVKQLIEASWFNKPIEWQSTTIDQERYPNGPLVTVLAYSFEIIHSLYQQMTILLQENQQRELQQQSSLVLSFEQEYQQDTIRTWERQAMFINDPIYQHSNNSNNNNSKVGSHLTPLSKYDALRKVETQFPSNNNHHPISSSSSSSLLLSSIPIMIPSTTTLPSLLSKPSIYQHTSLEELTSNLTQLHQHMEHGLTSLNTLLQRKDHHYQQIKQELTNQMVDKRKREEGKYDNSLYLSNI
jgi:hypothetical protein